jgi:hypothetical protein
MNLAAGFHRWNSPDLSSLRTHDGGVTVAKKKAAKKAPAAKKPAAKKVAKKATKKAAKSCKCKCS